MAIAKVEEYRGIGGHSRAPIQAPEFPPLRVQTVDFTSGAASTGSPLMDDTELVIVSVDTDAYMAMTYAEATDADTDDMHIFAGTHRPFTIDGSTDRWLSFVAV